MVSEVKTRENQTPKNRLKHLIQLLGAASIECNMMGGCFDGTRDDIELILHQCLGTLYSIENFDEWCETNRR